MTLFELKCNELAKIYSKQISIRKVPYVYTSARRFNKADTCGGTKIGKRLKANEHQGLFCHDCNIIYINSKKCDNPHDLTDGIIHELIHRKWFDMPHGKRFNRRIELIMNGKRY